MADGNQMSETAAVNEEDEGEWEDEEGWKDGDEADQSSTGRNSLPDGWSAIIGRDEIRNRYVIAYTTEDGTVLKNRSQLQKFLERRPDLDRRSVLRIANFSQSFARQQFANGIDHYSAQPQTVLGAAATESGQSDATNTAMSADTSRDEEIARAMQAAFDDEAGFALQEGDGEGSVDDDGLSENSFDDLDVGEVAAGGWRMREAHHDEEMAREEDIDCLELREVKENDDGHCPICQEDWTKGEKIRVLPCAHKFHPSCIDRWLKTHKATCPLCKKDVREDWESEEEEVWDPIQGAWVKVQHELDEAEEEDDVNVELIDGVPGQG